MCRCRFAFAIFYFWRARPTWTSLAFGADHRRAGHTASRLGLGTGEEEPGVDARPGRTPTSAILFTSGRLSLRLVSRPPLATFGWPSRSWSSSCSSTCQSFAERRHSCENNFRLTKITLAGSPACFPARLLFRQMMEGFSRELYWQHREYNALLGAVAMLAALVAKILWFHG